MVVTNPPERELQKARDKRWDRAVFQPQAALQSKLDRRLMRKMKMGESIDSTQYELVPSAWDHEHCMLCFAKFSLADGDLRNGYVDENKYEWLCEECHAKYIAAQ